MRVTWLQYLLVRKFQNQNPQALQWRLQREIKSGKNKFMDFLVFFRAN